MSFQLTKKIAIGAGLLADRLYYSELNRFLPPSELINLGTDWAYGWTSGLYYTFNKMTALNFSYTSPIYHMCRGTSTWGNLRSNNYCSNVPLPAVYSLGVTHTINPWEFEGTLRYVNKV